MRDVNLIRVPGTGLDVVSVNDGWSVQKFVEENQLHGRDIVINGRGIPASEWNNTQLYGAEEIFATASVKGNKKLC